MKLLAGPCVIESEANIFQIAKGLEKYHNDPSIDFYFKSSFDKANRTSLESFRGLGMEEGLRILQKVKDDFGYKVVTDVHESIQVPTVAEVVDMLQIPAFLCRQTDLLVACAQTDREVNIKKGQFLAPWDMKNVIEKVEQAGNKKNILTERGASFGYNNLVTDLRALAIMRKFGYPVIYDATHSVQLPGAAGKSSGGQREFVFGLSRAAAAFGCDGLFLEVHNDPDVALCDGPNSINLPTLKKLLEQVKKIERALKIC